MIRVVELGSIARAARHQNLTAAAVGQRIRALENHFDLPLLNRDTHRATPTDACRKLLPKAEALLKQFHEMSASIDSESLAGQFHIGAISTVLTGFLPMTIRHLLNIAPRLMLQIKPGTSKMLFNDLDEDRLNAVIINLPPHPLPARFQTVLLRREPLLLISRNAKGRTVKEILRKNPYIRYDSRSWGGLIAHQFLKESNLKPTVFCELDTLETIEKLVRQQMGVSLVPQWSGLKTTESGLDAKVIEGAGYARDVALVFPRECPRPRVIDALTLALQETANAS